MNEIAETFQDEPNKSACADERNIARARLLERLRQQVPVQIERWKRDDLYD